MRKMKCAQNKMGNVQFQRLTKASGTDLSPLKRMLEILRSMRDTLDENEHVYKPWVKMCVS